MADIAPLYLGEDLTDITRERYGDIYNPATGEITARVHFATINELNLAVSTAKQAFTHFSLLTPIKRSKILYQFRQLLITHTEELSLLLTQEHGKILADARGEVMRAIELVEHCCSMPNMLQGQYSEQVGTNIDCYSIRQPLGVCVGVSPFNFPVMISMWLAIPAIACGNTFIIKPSEKDPSSVLLLAHLLKEAGLPDGVFNVVNGDKQAVDHLITHPDVVAVSCVGSSTVAEYIYKTAITHNKRAQAFGSAKNHAIVMPDANLDKTIPALVGAGFGAAGERCMAISVVLAVTDELGDTLADALAAAAPKLTVTSGLKPTADLGPLITAEHLQRVKNYLQLGEQEGALLRIDGRKCKANADNNGFFLGASVFDNVTPEMRIYKEEIFGPVICIVRVPDYHSALTLVNAHQYGNGVAIFTQNGGIARQFASDVQVGMVGINVPIPVPVAYHPFGGWKQSVFGDTALHGTEGMRFYTKSKSITLSWPKDISTEATFDMPTNG